VSFFRQYAADADPADLLDPSQQVSTPWGTHDHGACDKCDGELSVPFRCLSCLEEGSHPSCPACGGRVEWLDRCPTCAGTGKITDTTRAGVSVFPGLGGLYRYLAERDADLSGSVIVEVEGTLSDERDLDAERGALLVHPTEIITRHPVDHERLGDLRRRLRGATGH
jgi:hypothetical protein